MEKKAPNALRTGFTTGACATAAAAAACEALVTGSWSNPRAIALPRGRIAQFAIESMTIGKGHARAGVRKDAGDDPDVTHDALILAEISHLPPGAGIAFAAGPGVGTITRPGLPLPVGEAAINPVPRQMICAALQEIARTHGLSCDFRVEISVPGGEELALKTWNPRLGIEGGLSILGTTGIVKPYSCAAWIASIHRGIDVARANGAAHVVGSTGSTSEAAARDLHGLPDFALLDMGDFAGGLLKYIRRHPLPKLTIAGGIGKMTKLAQSHLDLHSARSRIDFARLAEAACGEGALAPELRGRIAGANTALQALEIGGPELASIVAECAAATVEEVLRGAEIEVEILIFDRSGKLVGRRPFPDGAERE